MFLLASDLLKKNGYEHYEISNYAKTGFESKHNLKYWNFNEYLGFGPGAHSFINGERFYNKKDINKYLKYENEIVYDNRNKTDMEKEFILTSLRLLDGFSMNNYITILNEEMNPDLLENLNGEVEKGNIIKYKKNNIEHFKINEKRILFFDTIIYNICDF